MMGDLMALTLILYRGEKRQFLSLALIHVDLSPGLSLIKDEGSLEKTPRLAVRGTINGYW